MKFEIRFEDMEVKEDSKMTFWKLKGDMAWSRDIIYLWKIIQECRKNEINKINELRKKLNKREEQLKKIYKK